MSSYPPIRPAAGRPSPSPNGRTAPLFVRALLMGAMLVLLGACASAGASQGSASGSAGSGGSAAAGDSTGPVPSASSTGPAPSPEPSPAGECAPAPAVITIRIGHQPPAVCLRVGDSLTITAPSSAAQPWQPMTVTDASVLACTSQRGDQGSLTAVCRALKPGVANVSTMTAPFAGDPHGPAQFMWTLTIHVQPAA